MAFTYHHLDDAEVRAAMVELWAAENEELLASGRRPECYGADLLEAGWEEWERAMPVALGDRDDDWLVEQMLEPGFWRATRPRRLKSGGFSEQRVNLQFTANLICRGEFNIAYVRGLASTLLARGETEFVVYRADPAYEPRPECLAMEGHSFPLEDVLEGHRARYWPPESADLDAFSVPAGFGCHHSICSTAMAERAAIAG